MKYGFMIRLVCMLLVMALLPAFAFAEDFVPNEVDDGTPVTRSDFVFSLALHPDGFPDPAAAHYDDWQQYLSGVSLRGVADTQSLLSPQNRIYFDGGFYIDDELAVPFQFDAYHNYRYLRSAALGGDNIHLQMHNFFEFMLKGYFFLGLPMQLIALPLYPEATVYILRSYWQPISQVVEGEGDRTVDYVTLYELCETLDLIADDDFNRTYNYVTALLIDLGASDWMLDKLSCLEAWLDYLDPECEGMRITVAGDTESYFIGQHRIAQNTRTDDMTLVRVTLPDEEGYLYDFTFHKTADSLHVQFTATLDGAQRVNAALDVDGLALGSGTAQLTFGGEALSEPVAPFRFNWRYAATAPQLPAHVNLQVDWLHPATGLPAITATFDADMDIMPHDVLIERRYEDRNDVFRLNEGVIEQYKEKFLPTLALTAVPVLLDMPSGVINDIITFLNESGFMYYFGIY